MRFDLVGDGLSSWRDQLLQDFDEKVGSIVVVEQSMNVIENAFQNAQDNEAGFEQVISRQRQQLTQQTKPHRACP